ncbi:uncharacterized protein BDW70DRAFT_159204 [Aspergillus foveolatus]|uniref:uncharacterized protein n=1 Tax=Aspergillus foveolatus TaxID=210207 RepID=UPI003CCDE473
MDLIPQIQVSTREAPAARAQQTPVDTEATRATIAGEDAQADQTQDVTVPDAGPAQVETQPAEEPQLPQTIPFLGYVTTPVLNRSTQHSPLSPVWVFKEGSAITITIIVTSGDRFLTSPIVELIVGSSDKRTAMTAHQALLLESSLLSDHVKAFDDGPRRIELPDDDVESFGYFLQYLYTRDYSPSETGAAEGADDSGEQLLKHARVYTLAEKLGISTLKSLAHFKIHRINSTPRGELEYARYVYANTKSDDVTIRKPVSNFWGMRSHILRHEAEEEFRQLCLDVPQFCFDVLSVVLDQREKRAQDAAETKFAVRGSGRKRLHSGL